MSVYQKPQGPPRRAPKGNGRGRGHDGKAAVMWRERAKQTAKFLQDNDLKEILKEIVKLYPNFGQVNGGGYEHSSAGVQMALQRLSVKNPDKRDELKALLGFQKPSRLSVSDVRDMLKNLNIPNFSVGPSSTDRFEVRVPKAHYVKLHKLNCDLHGPRRQNGQIIVILDFSIETRAAPAPQGGESSADITEKVIGPLCCVIIWRGKARIVSQAFQQKHCEGRKLFHTYSVQLRNDLYEFTREPAPLAVLKPLVKSYNKAASSYFASKDYKAHVKAYKESLKASAS